MKPKQQERTKNATYQPTQGHWQQMNRKQRRATARKIQSEHLSLEMIHPDAAGIDICNGSHYVAVPPERDGQPVRRFGCTTQAIGDSDRRDAINWGVLDRGIEHSRTRWFGSVPSECARHKEPTE